MDPQVTLYALLRLLASDEPDRDSITEKLDNLSTWVERGGFIPSVTHNQGSFKVPLVGERE